MKKIITLILGLLLLIPIVASAPPVTQSFVGDTGIEIRYSQYEYLEQNEPFSAHTHIYNASDGLPIMNPNASCLVHIYNTTGSHILESELGKESNGYDYDLYVNGGNFSVLGTYTYILQCNTTPSNQGGIGGFVSGRVEVTANGFENEPRQELNFNYIMLLLLAFGFNYFLLYKKNRFFGGIMFVGLGIFLMSISTTTFVTGVGLLVILSSTICLVFDALNMIQSGGFRFRTV